MSGINFPTISPNENTSQFFPLEKNETPDQKNKFFVIAGVAAAAIFGLIAAIISFAKNRADSKKDKYSVEVDIPSKLSKVSASNFGNTSTPVENLPTKETFVDKVKVLPVSEEMKPSTLIVEQETVIEEVFITNQKIKPKIAELGKNIVLPQLPHGPMMEKKTPTPTMSVKDEFKDASQTVSSEPQKLNTQAARDKAALAGNMKKRPPTRKHKL